MSGQSERIERIKEEIKNSPLYSEDLAPIPHNKRTWSMWHLASLWVGMAVCIPTYMLASLMITQGLSWVEAIVIIALGNIIVTLPMVLNGHAGVEYGVPFPVIGRAAFGSQGIHIASVVRGIVACGWFGIQTWVGGLAFYELWHALAGTAGVGMNELSFGKFVGFGLFWLLNVFFIWRGTESIKWLEQWAAPILVGMGLVLIGWGWSGAGGFGVVLDQSGQLNKQTVVISGGAVTEGKVEIMASLNPITDKTGNNKATQVQMRLINPEAKDTTVGQWQAMSSSVNVATAFPNANLQQLVDGKQILTVQFKDGAGNTSSAAVGTMLQEEQQSGGLGGKLMLYLIFLTIMVGFWGTMAISIADITRFTNSQRNQVMGQFIGLPGTMVLYSFVGIFVTCAALINFPDVLIAEDAPWDPSTLLGKFENPVVVIIAQIFMVIATLSTNIAANVIAPANAFSNLAPKQLSFRGGGILTAVIGIIICPWWLMNDITGILLFVSGFLGPVLGVLVADYYLVRRTRLDLVALYDPNGQYGGFNPHGMIALGVGVVVPLIGFLVPAAGFLYSLSWFTGFFVSVIVYFLLAPKNRTASSEEILDS